MNRRLRKKLHVKEYAQYGMMATVIPIPDDADQVTAIKVKAIADKHGLMCWGGSNVYSLRPKDQRRWTPAVVTNLLKACDEGQISGYAMFALMSPGGGDVSPEVEADLLKVFDNPSYPIYIAYPVDMYNGRNYTLMPQ